jgi:ABC-type sugar transport system ATPase subunit
MGKPVLEAIGICKAFNGVPVLSAVDFSLFPGEVHAIVGQNGAGKSTLMKILNGVYKKDSGSINIDDMPCTYSSPSEAAKHGISMVFQDFSLIPSMKAYQNIFLAWSVSRKKGLILDDRWMRQKAYALLEEIGVAADINLDDNVENLSVGSRQIVEIAKALSMESKILIFDEPTASLSMAETASLFETIARLKARGISIIYITHYLRDVFRICDSVTVLRDGKVVVNEKIPETTLERVIHAMTGKTTASEAAGGPANPTVVTPLLLKLESVSTDKVNNVSFELHEGEILGLAGLLGSGRTELLRALYGLDRVRRGKITIKGKPVLLRSAGEAKCSGVALVPEDRRRQGLITEFSIYENILIGILSKIAPRFFVDGKKGRKMAKAFLSDFKIKASDIDEGVRYLSGGNQQKVVIAKNIADGPSLLLLDDPTFGIDIQSKNEIMDIIRRYVEQGNAAILISSEFNELIALCDRIIIMKKGEISHEIEVEIGKTSEEEILHLAQ